MDSVNRFDETELPPQEAFYNKLAFRNRKLKGGTTLASLKGGTTLAFRKKAQPFSEAQRGECASLKAGFSGKATRVEYARNEKINVSLERKV